MDSIQIDSVTLVDTHSHFDVDSFAADRNQALQRAQKVGVMAQIVPAIDYASWSQLKHVCQSHAGLYPAYGLHPIYLAQHRPQHLQALQIWLETEPAVAVGECGLDYFMDGLDHEQQQAYFDAQLRLARDFALPVVVHARRAVDTVTASLRRFMPLRGVVHSFSGSQVQAEQLFKLGFSLGIGGPVTYERASRLRKLVAWMPLEYLLLETDSPDQPDSAHRGQRNEPARLLNVLHTVAQLRDADPAEIAAATTANAKRLFGLDV